MPAIVGLRGAEREGFAVVLTLPWLQVRGRHPYRPGRERGGPRTGRRLALDARGRSVWSRLVDPIARVMAKVGITANGLTTAGLVLTAAASALVVTGELFWGGWVLVFGGLSDTFDGSVARARGESSVTGGFYDSVADRITDGMILSAVAWAMRGEPLEFALAAVALVAAQVTSYVRAKGESLGADCQVGFVERGERAIAIMAGLVFHPWLLTAALAFLAAGGTATVIQRFVHVQRQLKARGR